MTEENNDELKNLIEFLARAIAALKDSLAEFKEIDRLAQQQMAELRETLANIAQTQDNALAKLAKVQDDTTANTYRLINKLNNRQEEIVEIIKLLSGEGLENLQK